MTKKGKNVKYIDVVLDTAKLDEMLKLTDGGRNVPVIVENGNISIGFKGRR
jgi:glutaredoxin